MHLTNLTDEELWLEWKITAALGVQAGIRAWNAEAEKRGAARMERARKALDRKLDPESYPKEES